MKRVEANKREKKNEMTRNTTKRNDRSTSVFNDDNQIESVRIVVKKKQTWMREKKRDAKATEKVKKKEMKKKY